MSDYRERLETLLEGRDYYVEWRKAGLVPPHTVPKPYSYLVPLELLPRRRGVYAVGFVNDSGQRLDCAEGDTVEQAIENAFHVLRAVHFLEAFN